MAHAEGWIKAYELLEENRELPNDLKKAILQNRNGVGETMLHWYAIEGEIEVIEKIIDLGFDVNTQNDFKATPLFECVRIDRWNVVELLLKRGADTKIKDDCDEDIWQHLEYYGEDERIKKLKDLTSRAIQLRPSAPR